MTRRTIEVPSSWFADGARWSFGCDGYVENVTLEYPVELDGLEDEELDQLARDEIMGVVYVKEGNMNERLTQDQFQAIRDRCQRALALSWTKDMPSWREDVSPLLEEMLALREDIRVAGRQLSDITGIGMKMVPMPDSGNPVDMMHAIRDEWDKMDRQARGQP